jgi:poly(glycerol-phosphate) alpha-glucosyltransferase
MVHFVEPPAELRVGGLDAAIRSLEAALRNHDIGVTSGTAKDAAPGDVVHFHGLWQPSHARRSAELRRRGIASVVSPHGMLEQWAWRHKSWKKWPYFWLVECRHLRRAACVLATAPQEERRIREFLPQQDVRTLPLGFTADAQPDYHAARARLGWTSDETVLLFLSRLHAKKGVDLLFQALASIDVPIQTRVVIVGGGETSYVRSLRELAAENAARLPRIDWVGEVWGDARWAIFPGRGFILPSFALGKLRTRRSGSVPGWHARADDNYDALGRMAACEYAYIAEPNSASIAQRLREFFGKPPVGDEKRQAFANSVQATFSWSVLGPRYAALYRELASKT